MSRSIHTTRRTLKKLARKHADAPESLRETLGKAARELERKRRIKRQVHSERTRPPAPLAGTPIDTLPLDIEPPRPFVHHPASISDLRAVLAELPSTATEGISRIQFLLGREAMESRTEDDDDANPTRDPFTGRRSTVLFPGVYAGETLGMYWPAKARIEIYACVYDPARIPLPQSICELYLRLHALRTLVHEIAHHHDDTQRVRRGRWLSDRKENFEWYAEKMEHQWTLEIVVPYLERTYPREVAKLRKWVAHRGGITLPLAFFAGDHRRTERDGLMRLFYCTSSVFEHWVADLPLHQNLNASRLDFAWGLHYADLYDECLTIVERILQTRPEDVPTLACRADTLIHLDRLDEALVSADAALALEPTHAGARESRGNVLEEREDWHGLLDNCERWKVASEVRRPALRRLLLHRAIALCALDRLEESESCITAHLELFPRQSGDIAQRRAQRVRRNVRRRAGKETH